MRHLLIRAEASGAIGLGHVMRCLALAQAAQTAGVDVTFASRQLPAFLRDRLKAEGIGLRSADAETASLDDARAVRHWAAELEAPWVVVDGYAFGPAYVRALQGEGGPAVLFVDDDGRHERYPAEMVLNPNPLAGADLYPGRAAGGLLLGPRYALLRREFWPFRADPSEPPDTVRRLLVTLGGTDPRQLTLPLAERVHHAHPELALELVCGAAPPAALVDFASGREHIRLHTAVGDMAGLMVACDACVTAAGATLYELCVTRRPFAVVVVAENQRLNAAWVEREAIGLSLGWHESLDWDRLTERLSLWLADSAARVEQSERAARRVDGFGARRVVEAMRSGAGGPAGAEADGAST